MTLHRYDGPPLTWMFLQVGPDELAPATLAPGDCIELHRAPDGSWFTPVKTSKGLRLVLPDNHPAPAPEATSTPAPSDLDESQE